MSGTDFNVTRVLATSDLLQDGTRPMQAGAKLHERARAAATPVDIHDETQAPRVTCLQLVTCLLQLGRWGAGVARDKRFCRLVLTRILELAACKL